MKPGTKVIPTNKSHHSGIKGTVVADYGNMLLVKADDPEYPLGYKDTTRDGTFYQLDTRWAKEVT